jgi:hypothetical protein
MYIPPSIIRLLKSRRMRWAGNGEHGNEWEQRGIHTGYWWESEKERDHYEDQDIGG